LASISFAAEQLTTLKPQYIQMKVEPPQVGIANTPISVKVWYHNVVNGAPGTVTVMFKNIDTGQVLTKTVPVELTPGGHEVVVSWDQTESLPSGLYLASAILKDADGNEVASFTPDPKSIQSLIVQGKATRLVDQKTIDDMLAQFGAWKSQLQAGEAKAKAAGADTAEQHILEVVLDEAIQRAADQKRFQWYNVLWDNNDFFKAMVPKVLSELDEMAKNPKAFPIVNMPPVPADRYTIKGQYFYAGDQPVFLDGPAMFNFTLGALPRVRELGFNTIEVSTGPDSIFPTSEQQTNDARAIDYNATMKTGKITDVLSECNKLGLKVDLGLTPHFIPKWFFEKYPEAKNHSPNFMMPFDIEDPHVRELIEKWYAIVMPQIAGNPALNSIWILNEPGYLNPSARDVALFQTWLQNKYKTIDALNKTWGTQLSSFTDVKPATATGGHAGYTPIGVTTLPGEADWWMFTSERMTLFIEWMRDLVHKYDPTIPVTVKLFNATLNPQFKPPMRVNEEPAEDAMQITGYDGGSYPFAKSYADFLRSISPDKPMANLEYKFASPPARTKLDFWKEVMKGSALIDWWCWHTKPAFSRAPSYAEALYYAAIDKMDIQRLLPQVMAFNKMPRGPLAILYPDPVAQRMGTYFGVHDLAQTALTGMGYACDYVTEKRVVMGKLDDYKVLIMPAADYINDATYAKVTQYVRNGGIAVVIGTPPAHDEMYRPRDDSFFENGTGVSALIDVDGLQARKISQGKGKIYLFNNIAVTTKDSDAVQAKNAKLVQDFLEKVMQTELPPQPVVIRNCENRTIAWNQGGVKSYITWVCNDFPDKDLQLKPKYNFTVKSCKDLITGKTVDPQNIMLKADDCMLLQYVAQ
jgi:hypothetical protein